MKLVPKGQGEIPWWKAHPEHGFDWNAYRQLEKRLLEGKDFKQMQDIHQAIDEESLMEAYDARAMHDLERKIVADKAKANPLKVAEAPPMRADSPRQILKDTEFSGRGSAKAAGAINPWAMAAMLMFDPVEIGQDTWDPKYKEDWK